MGNWIAANILGSIAIAGSTAMAVAGVVSLVQAGNANPGDDGDALTRGIVLVDLAPHILTTGIITLVINNAAHRRAKANAGIAMTPFVVPISGGAVTGVGGSF